jgi:HSP20 family protein
MNVMMKNGGFPSLLTDVFTTDPLLGSVIGNEGIESDGFPRLGINIPPVNIAETPKDYLLELAAPGMTRKDFKLQVDEHRLSIFGKKTEKKEGEDTDWRGRHFARKEFSYKSFHRAFQVPENSKLDRIDAKYENGILKITIPKKEITSGEKLHEIPVQ